MLSYEAMQASELLPCADLAARAFGHYEYFSIYVPEDKKRQRFLRALLRLEFRSNQNDAAFFTAKKDGTLAAVAMLCAPD